MRRINNNWYVFLLIMSLIAILSIILNVMLLPSRYFWLMSYRHTHWIVNIVEITGIVGIIVPIYEYIMARKQSHLDYTMHVVSKMQQIIPNQNKLDNELNKAQKAILDGIINKATSIYIKDCYGKRLVSEDVAKYIGHKIYDNLKISEDKLINEAKLRVIGLSIIKLNRWAAYIDEKGMDFNMSLVNKQISGTVLRFLDKYHSIYRKMKLANVPLGNLEYLVDYWKRE